MGTRIRSLVLVAVAVAACGERRDAADLAVGVEPFERLRGMNVAPLRSGAVRAMRANAEPAPLEGLRERIGAFDVLYALTGYDGTDGRWPSEEALVLAIEATREWPSDSAALGGYRGAIRQLQAGLGEPPTCATVAGPGFTMRIAEWGQGGGWSVSASFAASDTSVTPALPAVHSIAVRRQALTAQFPRHDQPNPDERPTWTAADCTTGEELPA
jgi:hypothetical protein